MLDQVISSASCEASLSPIIDNDPATQGVILTFGGR